MNAAPHGYWLVGSDGGIFSLRHGRVPRLDGRASACSDPWWGSRRPPPGTGTGSSPPTAGIFSFGDSSFYGSIPGLGLHPAGSGLPNSLDAPIVGMVPTLTGHGYFMVASDGGVFAFGDARFEGSCPGIGGCSGPAVTVIPDHSGNGYWLVTANGGVYAFGDAPFYGVRAARSRVAWSTPWPPRTGTATGCSTPTARVAAFGAAAALGAPDRVCELLQPRHRHLPARPTALATGSPPPGAMSSPTGTRPSSGSMSAAGLNGQIIAAFGF